MTLFEGDACLLKLLIHIQPPLIAGAALADERNFVESVNLGLEINIVDFAKSCYVLHPGFV